ncbi:craniofacial development protein [Tasmannia lanceolata]|uniref:craniofacial development protein n=1 Tax=Tasmannia lanceolata TaxID=3420 RepID=UPI004063CD7B
MVYFRSFLSIHFHRFLKPQNASPMPPLGSFIPAFPVFQNLDSKVRFSSPSFISQRFSSASAQEIDIHDEETETELIDSESCENSMKSGKSENESGKKKKKKKVKKPLEVLFKESVGLSERIEESERSEEDLKSEESKEIKEIKKKLRDLEREVRSLREKANPRETQKKAGSVDNKSLREKEKPTKVGSVNSKTNSLHSLFAYPSHLNKTTVESKPLKEDASGPKELSPELVLFVNHLYKEGYLNNPSFLKAGEFDLDRLSNNFSQNLVKSAVEKFGQDHQENAKWLSGSELKKLALLGCPSVERKTVFAAKSLRSFFSIQEDTVCRPCKLKSSCKFANQKVTTREKLILSDALRVVNVYALGSVPHQLAVSDEVKASISKVLKDVVNLSK